MTQFLISIMDITPLSDSLSGNKALYDKAFKLVPGYRQQKICNLKNDAAKCRCLAAGLLLNYTTHAFIPSDDCRTRTSHLRQMLSECRK